MTNGNTNARLQCATIYKNNFPSTNIHNKTVKQQP